MAAIVCQGLQSCLESQLIEPRTLRLRLSSPKPHFSQSLELALKPCFLSSKTKDFSEGCHHDEDKHASLSSAQNPDVGGWSFLQYLPYASKESTMEKENAYVHPLIKRNSSTLSEKSLELCTENLGSETGTIDIVDNSIFTSSSSSGSLSSLVSESESGNSPTSEQPQQKPRQLWQAKKASNIRSFPPPLTTMSGSKSLQVMPHREDGRLVIKAVKAPSKHSYFQADRSEGRLRLCLLKDSASSFDLDEDNEARNIVNNDNLEIVNDTVNSDEEEEVEEEEYEEKDFEEEEEHGAYLEKEIEGNNMEVGAEIGKEEFQRLTRCKEGEAVENNGLLLNWEPFWVATS